MVLTSQELRDIPVDVYESFDTDDEGGPAAKEPSTFAALCRSNSSDCEAESRYRHLNGDRADEEEEPGVVVPMAASVLGSASRCLADTAAQLDAEAAGEELPRVKVKRNLPHQKAPSIRVLAKLGFAMMCFVGMLIMLHSHFNGARAAILQGEVTRLMHVSEALETRAQLLQKEKEDLSTLLLDPDAKKRLINMMQRSQAFDEFIEQNGFQSRVPNTVSVRTCLSEIFQRLEIQSLLDVPCGDASWQHAVDGIKDLDYVGADINPKALENAKELPQNIRLGLQFNLFDAVHFPLRRSFDLVLFRDILEQQRIQDTLTAILNFKQSGSRYIAATYWPKSPSETNTAGFYLEHAGWYEANLLQAPFSFPEPLLSCDNVDPGSEHRGKSMLGVWELKDLPVTERSVIEAEQVARPNPNLWSALPQVHIRQHMPMHRFPRQTEVPLKELMKFFTPVEAVPERKVKFHAYSENMLCHDGDKHIFNGEDRECDRRCAEDVNCNYFTVQKRNEKQWCQTMSQCPHEVGGHPSARTYAKNTDSPRVDPFQGLFSNFLESPDSLDKDAFKESSDRFANMFKDLFSLPDFKPNGERRQIGDSDSYVRRL